MLFRNSTALDSDRLLAMFLDVCEGWPQAGLQVAVRYSRGAEFSGSCYYQSARIFINIGRQNRYPYKMDTYIARAESDARHWWRELYSIELADAYQLALFVFSHEFYHWLVKKARRNVRQKEARCDRFAARVLVDRYGARVRDGGGVAVARAAWDFQDLEGFVAAARRAVPVAAGTKRAAARVPARLPAGSERSDPAQLLLFGE